jgi:hypothetical protein
MARFALIGRDGVSLTGFYPNFSVEKFSLGDDDPGPYGNVIKLSI